ncbi:MAG TPA: GAF domain-containing protein [Anaerolineales bacterium]
MNNLFHLPENTSSQARNAFWIILAFIIADLTVIGFLLYQVQTAPSWQLFMSIGSSGILLAFIIASLVFVLRGRTTLAIWLTVVPWLLVLLSSSWIITGLGFVMLLDIITVTIQVASLTLPSRQAGPMILTAVAVGILTFVADIFLPTGRIVISGFGTLLYIIVIVSVLVFGATILRQFHNYSLRTKLLIVLLAVALTPFAGLSYYNNLATTQDQTNTASEALKGAASQTQQTLDTFIQGQKNQVVADAQLPIMTEYLSLPPSERAGSATEADLNSNLRVLANLDSVYITSVALLDRNGVVLADTNTAEVGQSGSNRDYFKGAVSSSSYVSPIEFSQATGNASLYFSAPVKAANGNLLGVLRVRYSSDVIEQALYTAVVNFGHVGTFAALYDENNIRLVDTSDSDLNLKSVMPLPTDKLAQLQAAGRLPAGSVAQLSSNQLDVQTGLANIDSQPIFSADFSGNKSLDQAVGFKLKNQPWKIVFAEPNELFLAPAQAQTRNGLLIALIAAGLVSLVALFIGQLLSSPIVQLTNVVQQIAAGNINVQAQVTSQDEVGQLARIFNNMTSELRQTLGNIDRRAKDLATVASISTTTAAIRDPFQMLATAVHLIQRGFGLYHAHVFTYHRENQILQIIACGYKEGDEHEGTHGTAAIPIAQEQSLVARAARTRKSVIINNVRSDPGWLPNPLLPETRAELAVPMIVGDELLGVLDVQADHVDAFSDQDANIQMTLASQIATALQSSQAYIEAKTRADLEEMVNTISRKIQRAGTVEDVLQVAVRELGAATGALSVRANITVQRDNGNSNQN